MTTGRLTEALEQEHRAIDDGIESLAADSNPQLRSEEIVSALSALDLLRRHIYIEEESLFPPLRELGLFGPVMVMLHEHGRMWPMLDVLEQQLTADAASANSAAVGASCRELLALLSEHNMKEERILYVAADEQLSDDRITGLISELAEATVPSGWVCSGVRTTR